MRFNHDSLRISAKRRHVDKEGSLAHKSPRDGYRDQWFRLQGNLLHCFRQNESNKKIEPEPIAIYILEDFTIKKEQYNEREHAFSIVFGGDGDRKHFFSCSSQNTCNDWITALQKASCSHIKAQIQALAGQIERRTLKDPMLDIVERINAKSHQTKLSSQAPNIATRSMGASRPLDKPSLPQTSGPQKQQQPLQPQTRRQQQQQPQQQQPVRPTRKAPPPPASHKPLIELSQGSQASEKEAQSIWFTDLQPLQPMAAQPPQPQRSSDLSQLEPAFLEPQEAPAPPPRPRPPSTSSTGNSTWFTGLSKTTTDPWGATSGPGLAPGTGVGPTGPGLSSGRGQGLRQSAPPGSSQFGELDMFGSVKFDQQVPARQSDPLDLLMSTPPPTKDKGPNMKFNWETFD